MTRLEWDLFLRGMTPEAIGFVAAGILLLLVAWRGVRRGGRVCRGCGYLLERADLSRPCPECGRDLARRFATRRRVTRRLWLIAFGALLLLATGGAILGEHARRTLAVVDWYSLAPAWLLRSEALHRDSERVFAAREELLRRWRDGATGPEPLVELLRQGPRTFEVLPDGRTLDSWPGLVQALWEEEALPKELLAVELRRALDPALSIVVSTEVAPGGAIAVRAAIDPARWTVAIVNPTAGRLTWWAGELVGSGGVRIAIESAAIDDDPLRPPPVPEIVAPFHPWLVGVPGYGTLGLRPDRPTPVTLRVDLWIEIGPAQAPTASWRRRLEQALRFDGPLAPRPTTDPSLRPLWIATAPLPENETVLFAAFGGLRRLVEREADAYPGAVFQRAGGRVGAAYEVFGIHGEDRRRLGTLRGSAADGATMEWTAPYPWQLWPDARTIDLELLPSAAIAETVPDIGPWWAEPIRARDIPIPPATPELPHPTQAKPAPRVGESDASPLTSASPPPSGRTPPAASPCRRSSPGARGPRSRSAG